MCAPRKCAGVGHMWMMRKCAELEGFRSPVHHLPRGAVYGSVVATLSVYDVAAIIPTE